MADINFEQILKKVAAPRLKPLGYEYDARLQDRDNLFGFSKKLDEDIYTIVAFQRHQCEEAAWGWGFCVNLTRSKTQDPAEWYQGQYSGYIYTQLSYLLWAGYNLSIYPKSDYWWEAATADEFEMQLLDALDKIEQYGIPWLENPQSKNPDHRDITRWDEFGEVLQNIVAPELELAGYEIRKYTRAKGRLHSYFAKQLLDNLNAFIVFQQIQSIDRHPRFSFDVLLFRKEASDPFSGSRGYLELQSPLGKFLWTVHSVLIYPPELIEWKMALQEKNGELTPVQAPAPRFFKWEYDSREELEEQLKNALDKLKQYGIPWLEDLESKNPYNWASS
jgi:hypothetical protein